MRISQKNISAKAGLPPGTLIHIGEKKTENTGISVITYSPDAASEESVSDPSLMTLHTGADGVAWYDIVGISQPEIIEKIGKIFRIHPLTLEDILNTQQRPKREDFDDYTYLTIKMFSLGEDGEICAEQVSFILMENTVISFQEQKGDVFDAIRSRIRSGKGQIRKGGADYLLYALLDAVVDSYFEVFETIGELIEEIEEELVSDPRPETLQTIHALKRDLIFLRKSIWPLREVIGALGRGESARVGPATLIYFRDTYDHTIQVADTLETYRDMVSGILDIYLSSVSNRMNEVMKVLTIIATIFIPLTFIAGVYGMNFGVMPELGWEMGYPAVLFLMAVVALLEIIFFRRKGWL